MHHRPRSPRAAAGALLLGTVLLPSTIANASPPPPKPYLRLTVTFCASPHRGACTPPPVIPVGKATARSLAVRPKVVITIDPVQDGFTVFTGRNGLTAGDWKVSFDAPDYECNETVVHLTATDVVEVGLQCRGHH